MAARYEPVFDIDPRTGASIEVFYADRSLETFGRCGAGWFWWARHRGYAPATTAIGPFVTRYPAYRHRSNGELNMLLREIAAQLLFVK
jgi:hypothetical protein